MQKHYNDQKMEQSFSNDNETFIDFFLVMATLS